MSHFPEMDFKFTLRRIFTTFLSYQKCVTTIKIMKLYFRTKCYLHFKNGFRFQVSLCKTQSFHANMRTKSDFTRKPLLETARLSKEQHLVFTHTCQLSLLLLHWCGSGDTLCNSVMSVNQLTHSPG